MGAKAQQFVIKGMKRDLSPSKADPNFAFENHNIRISARDGSTLLSVTNERGNEEIKWKDQILIPITYRYSSQGSGTVRHILTISNPPEDTVVTVTIDWVEPDGERQNEEIDIINGSGYIDLDKSFKIEGFTIDTVNYSRGKKVFFDRRSDRNIFYIEDYEEIPDILEGNFVGYSVLDPYLILFTQNNDVTSIYRLKYVDDGFEYLLLYHGSLGLKTTSPIESLPIYENEDLQKVYWVDGINQPRVINIMAPEDIRYKWNDNSFNFIPELEMREKIEVKRNITASGVFSPGTIQYAFSYYNLYGAESNIFYTTPLYYISYNNRGASPEDKVSNSFDIRIDDVDINFSYIRIYSIHRTSKDSTPTVRRVADIPITDNLTKIFTDSGAQGDLVDPTILLYLGGEEITAGTMAHKDGTLFLGNYTLTQKSISRDIKEMIKGAKITFERKTKDIIAPISGVYPFNNELKNSSEDITTFKSREWYRFGLQFQYKTGRWSETVWVGDKRCDLTIKNDLTSNVGLIQASVTLPPSVATILRNEYGFKRVRGVVVYPQMQDREVVCQGVVNPTVYSSRDRSSNSPFSQSSWYFRPYTYRKYEELVESFISAPLEFRHNHSLPNNNQWNAEIQGLWAHSNPATAYWNRDGGSSDYSLLYPNSFFIDQSVLTFHSPDIEFDTEVQSLDSSKLQLRIVGKINLSGSNGQAVVTTTTPSEGPLGGPYNLDRSFPNMSVKGGTVNLTGARYLDLIHNAKDTEKDNYYYFPIYTWHRNGSLNNFGTPEEGKTKSAELEYKIFSNIRFSSFSEYLDIPWDAGKLIMKTADGEEYDVIDGSGNRQGITEAKIFNSNEVSMVKIPAPLNSSLPDMSYYGNIDTVLSGFGNRNGAYDLLKTSYPIPVVQLLPMEQGGAPSKLVYLTRVEGQSWKDLVKSEADGFSTDGIRMKYKSTPHAVFALNYTKSGKQRILPALEANASIGIDGDAPFWDDSVDPGLAPASINLHDFRPYAPVIKESETLTTVYYPNTSQRPARWWDSNAKKLYITSARLPMAKDWQESTVINDEVYRFVTEPIAADQTSYGKQWAYYKVVAGSLKEESFSTGGAYFRQDIISGQSEYDYLWLAELYKEVKSEARFGGDTEEAIENNLWVPCGRPINLDENITIKYTEGDTYFQRYDCLKTYPFAEKDQNSVVDILSFMCETRVNIDGRYDQNRGAIDNTPMRPTNFNLLNSAYTQNNNFFTYRALNSERFSLSRFPTSITWTKTKVLGEDIDTWTNLTLASTMDFDGDKGAIEAIRKYNNEIYCFQSRGISRIYFNSYAQMLTEGAGSGSVPVELMNSGKVEGKAYLSTGIGSSNKWSIITTPNGLYFVDDLTNSIYLFNQEGPVDLSDKLSFRTWVDSVSTLDKWNADPVEGFKNIVAFYDMTNSDIYFISNSRNTTVCFSELIGQFVSFFDYDNIPLMINLKGKFFSMKNHKLWQQNTGEYNTFFGVKRPYSMTVISNLDEPLDKIFNTLEWRATVHEENKDSMNTFDSVQVISDEGYQDTGKVPVNNKTGRSFGGMLTKDSVSLRRKFRMWRIPIPRDKSNHRDRIRGPWAKVTLYKDSPGSERMELHDLVVHIFE